MSALVYPTAERLHMRDKGDHGVPADRLARSFVVESNGCWRWTKGRTTSGYGHFWVDGAYFQAHVIVWIVERGTPPADLEPDHLCRHRWCVNPDCIEWVTRAVNVQRGACARLTPGLVEQIRRSYRPWDRGASLRVVAARFGVDHSTVCRIVNGERWSAQATA